MTWSDGYMVNDIFGPIVSPVNKISAWQSKYHHGTFESKWYCMSMPNLTSAIFELWVLQSKTRVQSNLPSVIIVSVGNFTYTQLT